MVTIWPWGKLGTNMTLKLSWYRYDLQVNLVPTWPSGKSIVKWMWLCRMLLKTWQDAIIKMSFKNLRFISTKLFHYKFTIFTITKFYTKNEHIEKNQRKIIFSQLIYQDMMNTNNQNELLLWLKKMESTSHTLWSSS